jgi:hypothetical protein
MALQIDRGELTNRVRKPLYTLSYADARRVLEDVLCARPV